jgi:transporter family protein
MQWFFIALVAPILWAFVNIADHYLISKYSQKEKERSSGGLVIFSSFIGIFIAFLILVFHRGVFDISSGDKLLLLLAGVFTIIWIVLYLYTLEIEEVSRVVPWFLTVPVFGYILGYIFLGETLTQNQILGSVVIFVGLILISINFSGEKKHFKKRPIIYMAFACFIIAVSGVIFKYVTVEGNFWVSSFWEYLGLGLSGFFIYSFLPKHRDEFHYMNKLGGRKIFSVNVVSELASISGNLVTNFALLLAPVTMVFLVGTFQPAIVLILTVLGTKFFPHIIKEDISRKVLIPKTIAIVLMVIGSTILFI